MDGDDGRWECLEQKVHLLITGCRSFGEGARQTKWNAVL
jgi:hypothetical protein